MSHVATLVAAKSQILLAEHINTILSLLEGEIKTNWLKQDIAADIFFNLPAGQVPNAFARILREKLPIPTDIIIQPIAHRSKKLLMADMDSTMIEQECIDELAAQIGVGEQVAHITEQAMRGELVFEQALEKRVALLAGLKIDVVAHVLKTIIKPMSGAKDLIAAHNASGGYSCLVSGGFYDFTKPIAQILGFHETVANALEVIDGKFTGKIAGAIFGPNGKLEQLNRLKAKMALNAHEIVAIGDGANDIPMICEAGLGIAYHAKQALADKADAEIVYGDLTVAKFAMGLGA